MHRVRDIIYTICDDDDDWCFMATFVHKVGQMGRTTSKGNEAKSKMKPPSDMLTPRLEHGGSNLWSNTLLLDHGGAKLSPQNIITLHTTYEPWATEHLHRFDLFGQNSKRVSESV